VSTIPGQTALIEMPLAARVGATLRTNPTTACLVAAYTGSSDSPVSPASEAVQTIRPPVLITRASRRTPKATPSTLTPNARR
jgi:hypothetical protein